MATPCVEDSCSLHLFVTPSGALSGDTKNRSIVTAGAIPIGGGGWVRDLNALPTTGDPYLVADMGAQDVVVNPSPCLAMNYALNITGREIQYDGDATGHFRVYHEISTNNGVSFSTVFSAVADYRWPSAPGSGISDSRPAGSAASAGVIPPGGSFGFWIRAWIVRLASADAGCIVTSPGFTFSLLAVTA